MCLYQSWLVEPQEEPRRNLKVIASHIEIPVLQGFMARQWQRSGKKYPLNQRCLQITSELLDELESTIKNGAINKEACNPRWGTHHDADIPKVLHAVRLVRNVLSNDRKVYYSCFY
ncbi:hypothetical protein [uncultured Photobacterium sp.]|uniref:hypothetical protein n=1 Tax=uncultured Photobacterium sp. TaxID=173973 RepID=UPI002606824A|nr:hypothetical protein [uncultured Photobacterium sp.]